MNPAWMTDAACLATDVDPEWWFAFLVTPEADKARKICATCPVREDCLAHAIELQPREGIWGGLSYREIRHLKGAHA